MIDPQVNPCASRIERAVELRLRREPTGWRLLAVVETAFGRYSGVASFLMAPPVGAAEEWQ